MEADEMEIFSGQDKSEIPDNITHFFPSPSPHLFVILKMTRHLLPIDFRHQNLILKLKHRHEYTEWVKE